MTEETFLEIRNYLAKIIKGSEFENHTYIVGGSVRDYMLYMSINDIDLVVDLEDGGIRLAEWLEKNGYVKGHIYTYPTYGTAAFTLKEFPLEEIECVMTRREQYKDKNSRNPETEYGTLEEDAFRRDFTCNALYIPVEEGDVRIIDPTGNGLKDIEDKIIRLTSDPNIVFFEDPLRVLRCLRFKFKLNWSIENETYEALKKYAERLVIVSKERVYVELYKIMTCDFPSEAIRMMYDTGVLKYVIPELCDTVNLTQNKYHFGDVFSHTLKTLSNIKSKDFVVRMAALLHDIGKIKTRTVDEKGNVHFYNHEKVSAEMAKDILTNLKCSTEFMRRVCFLIENHMITKSWGDDLSRMKMKTLRKLQYKCKTYPRFKNLMELIDADNNAHASEHCLPNQVGNIIRITEELIIDKTDMFNYYPPVNGKDVMEVKNIGPSEKVKECLDYVMKLAFNDPTMDRETMLKYVKGYKL